MKFRHELKHEISLSDVITLKSRLSAVMSTDGNGNNGEYFIRSLYFDNIYDTALAEKINGVNFREKFRIRCYNNDYDFIRLEKKTKVNGLCNKVGCHVNKYEVAKIIDGDIEWMANSERQLLRELYIKMTTKGIKPKTIVDYTRYAYIYPAGNVRVTIDTDIRTALTCNDFLDSNCVTITAGDFHTILEVKWDEFLPDIIKNIVQLSSAQTSAFSKYAVCRIYG